jgi:hypothetical protein
VAFLEYSGTAPAYVMFQVYDDADSDFVDDDNDAEVSYINVNYWYKNPADKNKAKQIKQLLKNVGFIYDGGHDVKDDGYYGREMNFILKEYV